MIINFFEQELWHLFRDGKIVGDPACSGRACLGTLGKDLRVRAQFVSTHISGEYDGLKLTVLNRTDGPVDSVVLKMKDLLGKKSVPGNPNFREGVVPHIWDNYGKFEWYAYRPTDADYETIRQAAGEYLGVFRDRTIERTQDGPKLVYICAPFRDETVQGIANDIVFARQKAQEVFQAGDIPICPRLMFLTITDLGEPEQAQEAQEIRSRLLEICQQVNVYGPECTEGMLAEINRALELGIEVKIGQENIERSQRGRHPKRKDRGAR